MKKTIKIMSMLLVLVMIIMAMSASAFAATNNDNATPIIGKDSKDVSDKHISAKKATNGALEANTTDVDYWNNTAKEESTIVPTETRATWSGLSPFTYYSQETSYSCGPASVKMALKYITGTTYSESAIRTGCNTTTSGTYLSNMITYINGQQSGNNYIGRYNQTKTTMKDNLYSGIVSYNAPPIIGVAFTTADGWDFNTGGHFLTIYSVLSDKTQFAICDPWGGYGGTTKWYNKSDTDLYNAYHSVNIGYMY